VTDIGYDERQEMLAELAQFSMEKPLKPNQFTRRQFMDATGLPVQPASTKLEHLINAKKIRLLPDKRLMGGHWVLVYERIDGSGDEAG